MTSTHRVCMNERDLPVPQELERLSTFIDSHTECIAGSSKELRSITLCATKHIFDWALETEKSSKPHLGTLLATLTQSAPPQTRSLTRSNSSTRKRDSSPPQKPQKQIDVRETPLPSLLIEGMNTDQIWQQLDLRAARICANLRILQGDDEDGDGNLEGENSDDDESDDEDEDEDEGEGEIESEDEDSDEDADAQMDIDDESLWEELSDGEEDEGSETDGVADLQEDTSEDEEDDGPPTSMLDVIHSQQKQNTSKSHSQGPLDLDDRFFDLASFNAETNEAEQTEVTKRKLNFVTDDDSTEESDVDIFGSVDDSTIEGMDDGLDIFYADFFEPPRGTQNKSVRSSKVRFHERVSVKKIKAVGKGLPLSFLDAEDSDEEDGDDFDDDSSPS